ncbi:MULTISPECIES: transposase [Streptomyces]|uniref:transposase n=1 Tax=Streptomyces TaxID=1883 RepID=UPI0022494E69|nr:transposase [Streptomyces sp. JHD 1]MCX2971905.1 transposase [Streptomyces sp. JHD 1]
MPVPCPREFRDKVVRVALNREKGVTLAQVAKDFGVHEMTLSKWIRQAAVEEGGKPPRTRDAPASRQPADHGRAHAGGGPVGRPGSTRVRWIPMEAEPGVSRRERPYAGCVPPVEVTLRLAGRVRR